MGAYFTLTPVKYRKSGLKARGAYLQLEDVEFLPEASDRRTPEDLLIAAEDAEEDRERDARHMAIVAKLSKPEAIAITLSDGLFGQPRSTLRQVAFVLGTTEAEAADIIAKARTRTTEGT